MQGIIETDPKIILEFMAEENRFAHAQLTLQNLQSQPVAFKVSDLLMSLDQNYSSLNVLSKTQCWFYRGRSINDCGDIYNLCKTVQDKYSISIR
ncbi:unnamed protein product (macronuclear) [Paramecium tetraurelia]|uniref:CTLH domain-containing protein n=1 Tax=Paramecium tetraurelia TaxID=5888 RepID=A0CBS6_PARTE|nr:uncharacterized protein GSPATT00037026001 [Paramecium tetraurelia]CAK68243.1 unnamed protein product [Paramecium tetraurelia]|eukprot:XP_001435640.1 hypothetical protein (macronuclear) [Paramecium tetraurelia strain d4-2]